MSELSDKIEHKIQTCFPLLKYATEEYVVYRGHRLFFDFIIPELNIYIEVQGQQHYKIVPFFHKFSGSFRNQKYRDQLKTEWCAENDIILVVFSYKEINKDLTDSCFRNKILKAVRDYNNGSSVK